MYEEHDTKKILKISFYLHGNKYPYKCCESEISDTFNISNENELVYSECGHIG